MSEYRIVSGSAKEVQDELNVLEKKYYLTIEGFSANENITVRCIMLSARK